MKKSWHPMLMKNQKVVWDKEQEVIAEKKKLEQLRREKEEERQLQQLKDLQHSSTGHKASERMEWMYAAPATGSSVNASEMEDYLLGKKRVDTLLKGEDEKGLYNEQHHSTQQPTTSTLNSRDTTTKVKLDPMLAIKQQEQAAYDALINNPIRLREMRLKAGIADPSSKRAAKDERKRARDEKRRMKESVRDRDHGRDDYSRERRDRDDYYRSRDSRDDYPRRQERRRDRRDYDRDYDRSRDYDRPRQHYRPRSISPRPSRSHSPQQTLDSDSRAAKLAAMSASARDLQSERDTRLTEMQRRDAIEREADEKARWRDVKYGGHNAFIANEQRKVYSGDGGLAEQMRRRG